MNTTASPVWSLTGVEVLLTYLATASLFASLSWLPCQGRTFKMGCRGDTKSWLLVGSGVGAFVAVLGAILIPVGDLVIESTVKTVSLSFLGSRFYSLILNDFLK